MKKISLFIIYSLLAVIFITSCLGDSNQKITIANQPGVVMKSGDEIKIQLKDSIFVYSNQLSGVDNGDCLLLKYNLDYGLGVNADSGRQAGFFTVDLIEANGVPLYTILNELDTTTMFRNERLIKEIQQGYAYILDRLFLYTIHPVDSVQLQNLFELAYNARKEPSGVDGNNNPVYNLYLRVFKNPGVEEQRTSTPDRLFINAFNLAGIAAKEKAAGKDSLFLKINYISSFSRDTSSITGWASIQHAISLYPKRR
ncbi:MAG: hypothetical protein LBL58_01140 [Tannerellaceae bacterium]|nr:hypothetical protein [Tannerellaceae bacterium]